MELGVIVRMHEGDIGEGIKDVSEFGFKTCQISCWDMTKMTDENAEKIITATKKYGVKVSAFWCGWEGATAWDFVDGYHTLGLVPLYYRKSRIQNLKQGSDFAKKIGVTDVATHMGFLPENCKTDEYSAVIEAIKEVALYMKKNGQNLLFETGQETPITLKRTIQTVGTGNLGINLDPANLLLYGKANPCDAVDIFGEYVKNVHAKDGEYPTDPFKLGEEKRIGDGRVNFPLLIKKLKEKGYDGPLTIEREISGEQQQKDIIYAKKFLEDILNDQASR